MDRLDRLFQLHRLLRAARRPIPMQRLADTLECSQSTVKRYINFLRDRLMAPLEYHNADNGWFYDEANGERFELPGVWFSSEELHTLFVLQEMLSALQPGLLADQLAPVKRRVTQLMRDARPKKGGSLENRVQIIPHGVRYAGASPTRIADALLSRRQVHVQYHSRGRNEIVERVISPQRLLFYRDNWYLAGWCHVRADMRLFSVDRIQRPAVLQEMAKEVAQEQLNRKRPTEPPS